MDDHFVRELQGNLSPGDELWCLGDMSGPPTQIENLRARLASIPCMVHWIEGNHDPDPETVSNLVEFHGHRQEINLEREKRDGYPMKLVLDHYPLHSWSGRYHGSIHLHGHVHGQTDNSGMRRPDIGVDTNRWGRTYDDISEETVVDTLTKIPAPKHRNSGSKFSISWPFDFS
jgi:calcineurin-like phosphoesterase family protein